MTTTWISFAVCCINTLAYACWAMNRITREQAAWVVFAAMILMALADARQAVISALAGQAGDSVNYGFLCALCIVLACVIWHWMRKGKRKIRELLGAKSKALRDKLVKKVRGLRLKPALRPVPSPA